MELTQGWILKEVFWKMTGVSFHGLALDAPLQVNGVQSAACALISGRSGVDMAFTATRVQGKGAVSFTFCSVSVVVLCLIGKLARCQPSAQQSQLSIHSDISCKYGFEGEVPQERSALLLTSWHPCPAARICLLPAACAATSNRYCI